MIVCSKFVLWPAVRCLSLLSIIGIPVFENQYCSIAILQRAGSQKIGQQGHQYDIIDKDNSAILAVYQFISVG